MHFQKTLHERAQNLQINHRKRLRHMPETKYPRVAMKNFQKLSSYIWNAI